MHVGMSVIFQNPGEQIPDKDAYARDLHLAMQAEPLGFQSIWSVEHHFTDYTMCPDVFQFLTYMAAKTEHIQLGSMVCVLPWHDPVRVAEQISMLDNLSDGRVILGMGRGTGRVEFDGFGVDMGTARLRFKESAEIVLNALEQGWIEYSGELLHQQRRDIRPVRSRHLKVGRMRPPYRLTRRASWRKWVSAFSWSPKNRGRPYGKNCRIIERFTECEWH